MPDNFQFARVVKHLKNKADADESKFPGLAEITQDETKAKEILDAAKASMGTDISDLDMLNIEKFADRVIHLSTYQQQLQEYLRKKMHDIAPNLSELVGEHVGARLISHAGSLTNLAKYPASTVQILGAEKALFRALKTRGNTPKYGLIFHSSFIGRAGAKNKGRISRYLANKCSIASRIDAFSDVPTTKFGQKLNSYESPSFPSLPLSLSFIKNDGCRYFVICVHCIIFLSARFTSYLKTLQPSGGETQILRYWCPPA